MSWRGSGTRDNVLELLYTATCCSQGNVRYVKRLIGEERLAHEMYADVHNVTHKDPPASGKGFFCEPGSAVALHEADPEPRALDSSDWQSLRRETRRREERSQEPHASRCCCCRRREASQLTKFAESVERAARCERSD